jgi:3-deoxy-D-arabino-heptulosonate 7-phosphate (DAHP) synthase
MLNGFFPTIPIIAGPCALESRSQLRDCIEVLHQLSIPVLRACAWKPRTTPGFEGHGEASLSILLEETLSWGIIPATEVVTSVQAQAVVLALKRFGKEARMLVWIGARNQNHFEQCNIARIFLDSDVDVALMFKNQMWEDERHWLGIYEHIRSTNFPKGRLLTCHRGFAPGKTPNPYGFRNLPDFEMAMRVKEQLKIPMFLDPSHIGGTRERVVKVCEEAKRYEFDGLCIEMQPFEYLSATDAHQQVFPDQLKKIVDCFMAAEEEVLSCPHYV